MNNIKDNDLNLNGTFNQGADFKSVKLAGAEALEKEIKAVPEQSVEVPTMAAPSMNTAVPPVQPVVDVAPVTPAPVEPVVAPAPQVVEPVMPQATIAPVPPMPEIGPSPEVYNPIQDNPVPALDDAQQKLETPTEFTQSTVVPAPTVDTAVPYVEPVVAPPVAESVMPQANIYSEPVAPVEQPTTPVEDVKVEPLPGEVKNDGLDELLENIGKLVKDYVSKALEQTGDKKAVDAAMAGLNQVQQAIDQGAQALSGQTYQPIDMTHAETEGIQRAA